MSYSLARLLSRFFAAFFISLFGLLFQVPLANAAVTVEYDGTQTFGGNEGDRGSRVATDHEGNVYLTGYFQDTVDFNPSGTADVHTSNGGQDVFLTKYNYDGSYAWTKAFGGSGDDVGVGVTTDHKGNVYMTGQFENTVDFNPGGSSDEHESVGGDDVFVSKYRNNGTYVWTKTFGGVDSDRPNNLAVDHEGNLYVAGVFRSTVDFNPDGEGDVRVAQVADPFLVKYSSSENYEWTKTISGGTAASFNRNLAVDTEGYVYVVGSFRDTVDFNPDGNSVPRTSQGLLDGFIVKYSSEGDFQWVQTLPGPHNVQIPGITLNAEEELLILGFFTNTVTLDPDGKADERTSEGSNDVFYAKYQTNGSYEWAETFGGAGNDIGLEITSDAHDNVYLVGYFSDTVDFNPGETSDEHTSNGGVDSYVTKFNADGDYFWTKTFGGTGSDQGRSIAVDMEGNLYATGQFSDTVDFDPDGLGDEHTSNGGSDIYLLNLQTYEPDYSLENYSKAVGLAEGETLGYEVSLTAPPESNVEVNLEIDQPKPEMGSGIEVSPSKVTFTPSNWNTPQTITIEALSDSVITGQRKATIRHAIATADVDYKVLGIADVHVFIDEFDTSRPNRHAGLGGNAFRISSVNGEYYGGNRTIRTNDRKPTIRFNRSTDNHSGLDYYQIRLYRTDALGRKSGGEYVWIDNIPDEPATDEDRIRIRDGHEIKYRGNSIVVELTDNNKYRLDKGTYFMRVRAFDKAGNSRNTGEIRLIIDDRYTAEFKRMGRDPLPEDTVLTLTHIGGIPNAGVFQRFYYTSSYMVFRGNIDQEEVGFDIQLMLDGVEATRSETFLDGSFRIPVMVPRGTSEVEIKVASVDADQARKRLMLTVDPTRQSFPPHLR